MTPTVPFARQQASPRQGSAAGRSNSADALACDLSFTTHGRIASAMLIGTRAGEARVRVGTVGPNRRGKSARQKPCRI